MDLMGLPLRCFACGMPGRLLSMYLQASKDKGARVPTLRLLRWALPSQWRPPLEHGRIS